MFIHGIRSRFDGDGGRDCLWEVHLSRSEEGKGRSRSSARGNGKEKNPDQLQEEEYLDKMVVVLEGEDGGNGTNQ
jgi:hypothetical protein